MIVSAKAVSVTKLKSEKITAAESNNIDGGRVYIIAP
jgi:hypothetical protein